jgi:hypothetical protein
LPATCLRPSDVAFRGALIDPIDQGAELPAEFALANEDRLWRQADPIELPEPIDTEADKLRCLSGAQDALARQGLGESVNNVGHAFASLVVAGNATDCAAKDHG